MSNHVHWIKTHPQPVAALPNSYIGRMLEPRQSGAPDRIIQTFQCLAKWSGNVMANI